MKRICSFAAAALAMGAPVSAAELLPIITTVPETAVRKDFDRSGFGWNTDLSAGLMVVQEEGLASPLWFDGDDVYLLNPFTQVMTDSFIKGRLEDDRLVFDFPQAVYEGGHDGVVYQYMANRLYFMDDETGGSYYIDKFTPNSITFERDGDSFVMEGGYDGRVILGLTIDNRWEGFGDYNIRFTPFEGEAVTLPESVTTENWGLSADGIRRQVPVGIDGDDIYIGGISTLCPSGWIKGTLADGKATFPFQYIGIDNTFGYRLTLKGGSLSEDVDGRTLLEPDPSGTVTFTYDADGNSLTADMPIAICGGVGSGIRQAWKDVTIRWQSGEISLIPATPRLLAFQPFDEQYGYGAVLIEPTAYNVDGDILDTDNLYYRLFVDGEPFTFYPDEYYQLLSPMEWIPFDFTDDWDFNIRDAQRMIVLYLRDIETVGVQQMYRDGETEYLSETDTYGQGGIGFTPATAPSAVSVRDYDLTGRPVGAGYKGVVIRRQVMDDGTSITTKTMK